MRDTLNRFPVHPVSIPSRGFWFFEDTLSASAPELDENRFQSPRGDFGFLKHIIYDLYEETAEALAFQSPRGDFGFLKLVLTKTTGVRSKSSCFNPLAGILVF